MDTSDSEIQSALVTCDKPELARAQVKTSIL